MWRSQLTVFLVFLANSVFGHFYQPREPVHVWADRAGLYDFPLETYSFAALPLCELSGSPTPSNIDASVALPSHRLSFGELLEGKREYEVRQIQILWPDNSTAGTVTVDSPKIIEIHEICRMRLTTELVTTINALIRRKVWISYQIDGISVYGLLGSLLKDNSNHNSSATNLSSVGIPKLFSHRTFIIERNKDQIVGVGLNMSSPVELKPNKVLRLTYAVNFVESNKPFTSRLQPFFGVRTLNINKREQLWSTGLSCGLGLLLVALVGFVTQQMSQSQKPTQRDLESNPNDSRFGEPGYRAVAREVFKQPSNLAAHSVVVSSGAQVTASILLTALICLTYVRKGWNVTPTTVFLNIYTLCQPLNGILGSIDFLTNRNQSGVSSPQSGARTTISNLASASFWQFAAFPLLVIAAFIQLNTVNAIYGSSRAIDFLSLFSRFIYFLAVNGTLHIFGTYLGLLYCRSNNIKPPVTPNNLSRPVFKIAEKLQWKLVLFAGLIPFGAICTPTHLVYRLIWNEWEAIPFSYLLITLILFIGLVMCSNLISLCVLLQAENYKWHWFPMKSGAVTAGCFIFQALIQQLMARTGTGSGTITPAISSMYLHGLTYWTATLYVSAAIFFCASSVGYVCCHLYIRRLYSIGIKPSDSS